MNTDGGAGLEDGRMPNGSPRNFGEGLGESKAFVWALWQAPPEVIIEDREIAVERHN